MRLSLLTVLMAGAGVLDAYPLDAAERTGIRRLAGYRSMKLPRGALWTSDRIALRLRGVNDQLDITPQTPRDAYLQAGIQRIFSGRDPSYAVALLDISDPRQPKYASLRGDLKRIPGSVGKLLVAGGLLDAIAGAYPDVSAREKLLRETVVAADTFIVRDGKTVPFYADGARAVTSRPLQIGDRFSLWEWADHMLSQSSNAGASMTWKQALLIRHFGARYPVAKAEEESFLKTTPKRDLSRLAVDTLEAPLRKAGIDTDRLRLGTFFTRTASATIPGGGSYACPDELLRWLVRVEQGRMVDPWSSLELKRLMYFARPRYRYAASRMLDDAGLFFKSGSLFECSPGGQCKSYAGDVMNMMHSVAIVESGKKVYLVAIMSNVLRVNSAVEHAAIAGEIEKLIQSRPE